MKLSSSLRFLLTVAAALSVSTSADAVTIDFSTLGPAPDGGDLGSPTNVDPGTGLTVSGLWLDGATWKPANLYVRNQTNDHGFGICSPADAPPCPGPDGGGDINELDNLGAPELIRLALPPGYEWESVQLSSLDDNDDGEPDFEFGRLWADVDGNPATFDVTKVIWEFMGHETDVEPLFDDFTADEAIAPYLFFEPFDWRTTGMNDNNDFLVWKAAINQTRVPEPATLGVLGIGLVALRLLRRRR
jgi:hypothetical protein